MIIELFIKDNVIKGHAIFTNTVDSFINFYKINSFYKKRENTLINFNDSFIENIFYRIIDDYVIPPIYNEIIIILNINNLSGDKLVEYIYKYLNKKLLLNIKKIDIEKIIEEITFFDWYPSMKVLK